MGIIIWTCTKNGFCYSQPWLRRRVTDWIISPRFVTRSPASLLVSRLKLEFGPVVFPMHSSHVVHNCSAMCLHDLILAVIDPVVTNHKSPYFVSR